MWHKKGVRVGLSIFLLVSQSMTLLAEESPLVHSVDTYQSSTGYNAVDTPNSLSNLKLWGIIPEEAVYQYEAEITREQFCEIMYAIIAALDENKLPAKITDKFVDTDNRKILALAELGLVNGTTANTFSPDGLITGETADKLIDRLVKVIKFEKINLIKNKSSDKAPIPTGTTNNRFNPKDYLTYEQALVIINNGLFKKGQDIQELMKVEWSKEKILKLFPNYKSIEYIGWSGGDADANSYRYVAYAYDFGKIEFSYADYDNALYYIEVDKKGIFTLQGYDIGDYISNSERSRIEAEIAALRYGAYVKFTIENNYIKSIRISTGIGQVPGAG